MNVPKRNLTDLLKVLPENEAIENNSYRHYVYEKVRVSLAAVAKGEVLTNDEAMGCLSQWLDD